MLRCTRIKTAVLIVSALVLFNATKSFADFGGTVTDSLTAAPLDSVLVVHTATGTQTLTDSLGAFTLSTAGARTNTPGTVPGIVIEGRTIHADFAGRTQASVYDFYGNSVPLADQAQRSGTFTVPALAPGCYLISLRTENAYAVIKTVITEDNVFFTSVRTVNNSTATGKAATASSEELVFCKDGYYGKTITANTDDTDITVALVPRPDCGDSLTDDRDGRTYPIVCIGTQCWMAENLNVGTLINGNTEQTDNDVIEKYAYRNDTTNTTLHGGLYQWAEAMAYDTLNGARGICPKGWHLPTDKDWKTLEMRLSMSRTEADDVDWRGTDQGTQLLEGGTSGFDAHTSGYAFDGSYYSLGTKGYFWSSSPGDTDRAWYRILGNSAKVFRGSCVTTSGLSVRCVRD